MTKAIDDDLETWRRGPGMPRLDRRRLRIGLASAALAMMICSTAQAQPLSPQMAPLGFLLGRWISLDGRAGGDRLSGVSRIEPAANGTAILRQDHTEILDGQGKAKGAFDQVMLIYPEDGSISADYFDGVHHIHYRQAVVGPGRSVVFATADEPGRPVFRLTYALTSPQVVSIRFEMKPPGRTEYQTVAEGAARRDS